MEKTQEVLLAAAEIAANIQEIIVAHGLQGQEGAVLEALKAAHDNSHLSAFAITELQPY